MKEGFTRLIRHFREINGGVLPEKIIWYRGGGSTGLFQSILKNEVGGKLQNSKFLNFLSQKSNWTTLRRAILVLRDLCRQIKGPDGEEYHPGITFIVSMRNSHQKLFAVNKSDRVGMGQNVRPGTCLSGYGATPDRNFSDINDNLMDSILFNSNIRKNIHF